MDSLSTFHILIRGQVQGVGFRPFIYRLAIKGQITGWVNNTSDGVHLEVNATLNEARKLVNTIEKHCPLQARIESISWKKIRHKKYPQFSIVHSDSSGDKVVRLSPDFGLCEDCIRDLENTGNRRSGYSFTTCTNCGPRFSIINGLPYDRPFTEMANFTMCDPCQQEYNDPLDRRFYSQTNSCPTCKVSLQLSNHQGDISGTQDEIIDYSVKAISSGKIGAIKGIGGFQLVCDATNEEVINSLRKRKKRPHKPFAIMYPDIQSVWKDCYCEGVEEKELTNTRASIVLLRKRSVLKSGIKTECISPNLDTIGVMLPYAPLLYLISKSLGKPMVATSGNVSGSPIIYQDEMARKELIKYADFVLGHDRNIVIPQDDSVVRFHYAHPKPILVRRSRGWAPSYFGPLPGKLKDGTLALGAQMKGAMGFVHHGQVYLSQYLGNLESYDAQVQFEKTLEHFEKVLDFTPSHIVTDLHPQYFSHELGRKIAEQQHLPIRFLQHHKAHFAAVLQENDLVNSNEKILGVIWDGTGYGDDGNIWGGEFFTWETGEIKREFHFQEVPNLLGDKMALEPRIAALAFSQADPKFLESKFSQTEWALYSKLAKKDSLKTTSVGRLFDAVSSLLGIIDRQSYEGQAAMYLETLARQSDDKGIYETQFENKEVKTSHLISAILQDLDDEISKDTIALRFHHSLVHIIKTIANKLGVGHIVFSGGVFQNALLIDLIYRSLSMDHTLYLHKELSPNDENIPFGQIILDSLDH